MPRAQIKDEKTYQALRREGNSEEKSARIANAAAGSSRKAVAKRGGRSGSIRGVSIHLALCHNPLAASRPASARLTVRQVELNRRRIQRALLGRLRRRLRHGCGDDAGGIRDEDGEGKQD